ncbi:universal stress protein [Saccharopolyspora taberi]|uniref:Universal stress protein n=1 Tax=Saccharopolyspora taberi TaxID=60895 RepID=A0ABN3VDQ5_9PSEU
MEPDGPVVVGVDGSKRSQAAAQWAADEAERRHAPLRVLAINPDPPLTELAKETADRIAAQCRDAHPGLEIDASTELGQPAAVLVRGSRTSRLLVVGSRGRSSLAGVLLGSVSTKVATHAHCPVVVVRDPRTEGPVVVGVDSSPHSGKALEFAVDSAVIRAADLVAVQVWHVERASGLSELDLEAAAQEAAERSLSEQLAGRRTNHPDLTVHKVTRHGHPVDQLTEAAREAQLLVVGHRGRGGFPGLLTGSVAMGVLQHAVCPVAVVRGDDGSRS